jgi:hypothetical protein
VRKCVSVDELDSPVKQTDETSQYAEENTSHGIALTSFGLLRNRAQLSQAIDDSDYQAPKTDAAEGVGHASLESTQGRMLGKVV